MWKLFKRLAPVKTTICTPVILQDSLTVADYDYPITITIEQRRTSTVRVRHTIDMHISSYSNAAEQKQIIERFKVWARKKIEKHPDGFRPRAIRHLQSGDRLTLFGIPYQLQIKYIVGSRHKITLDNTVISLALPEQFKPPEYSEVVKKMLRRELGRLKQTELHERIQILNRRYFQQQVNRVRFKDNRSNWGSCSTRRNITIAVRLLAAPVDVFEYVCIHELAHLIHLNHGKPFWELVQGIMPDYKNKIHWLKLYGHQCDLG